MIAVKSGADFHCYQQGECATQENDLVEVFCLATISRIFTSAGEEIAKDKLWKVTRPSITVIKP